VTKPLSKKRRNIRSDITKLARLENNFHHENFRNATVSSSITYEKTFDPSSQPTTATTDDNPRK
jgi:hypothetical protein